MPLPTEIKKPPDGVHPLAPWRPNDYTCPDRIAVVNGTEDEMTRMFGPGRVFTPQRMSRPPRQWPYRIGA